MTKFKVTAVTILSAAVFIVIPTWCMLAPAIPYAKIAKMHAGMTANDVVELLGEPGSKSTSHDGSERWVYSRGTWAMYKVFFGMDGIVEKCEHDF